ncbi:hypothetical protein RV14_GL002287 [Enterococcus ratti]|uniref:Uncharacterized protein n=1 Tax=Enterococcus ratti TaxID=150033 RepID=A0A1L8WPF6_9ENTE|nr:hypothetical protein RV14_GL002287 [Enterococcus ratti]
MLARFKKLAEQNEKNRLEDYFRKNYVGIFLMLMGKEVMFKET